ncbi:MAG: succinate dehydrogenase, hydrophobic membrane anchor protein [Burkholderiales bacterium]
MVNRLVVGAHYGLRDWLVQRGTAVVMAIYTIIIGAWILIEPPVNYAAWKAMFSAGWMRVATLFFFVSLLLHAWVGMRDIVMDYVKPTWLRLSAHLVIILVLVAYAGWSVQILWRT